MEKRLDTARVKAPWAIMSCTEISGSCFEAKMEKFERCGTQRNCRSAWVSQVFSLWFAELGLLSVFFNAHFVSLLQTRKNMRSPVCACTYSAPYLFRTNIDDSFLRSSSSCIFVHFATCVKVITPPTCKRFTLTHLCLSKNDIKSFANSSAR